MKNTPTQVRNPAGGMPRPRQNGRSHCGVVSRLHRNPLFIARSVRSRVADLPAVKLSSALRRCALRRGFSLVEVVIVMVLMGAIFAIAVPRIDFAKTNINAATQQAALTLMKAHRDAIQRQHNVVVAFDTAQMLIRVHADADNDGVMDAGEPITQIKLEDGVRFRLGGATARTIGSAGVTFTQKQNGLPAVTFTRAGSASEFGGFYLSSVSAGQAGGRATDTRAFEVERAVGRFERFYWNNGSWTREW